MSFLLPLATLACAIGIVSADRGWFGIASAQAIAVVALAVGLASRSAPRVRAAAAVLLFWACGVFAMAGQSVDASIGRLIGPRDQTVDARVCGSEQRGRTLAIELCDCVAADSRSKPVPRRVTLFEGMDGESRGVLGSLRDGEFIRARLRLTPFRLPSNPGARDISRSYQRRGIGARASLRDASLLVRWANHEEPSKHEPSASELIERFRLRTGERLSASGSGGSLARALALGDRTGLAIEHRDAFTKLGIGHLLAVSGLHVALVAGLAFTVVRRSVLRFEGFVSRRDPRRVALAAAFFCAAFYACITGWGIPVRRALLFLAVLCLSVWSRRTVKPIQLLSLAALPLLVVEPHALFEMGAQLSFVASAALLLARSDSLIATTALGSVLRTSVTAIVATAPLVAWHGGGVGVYGLAANLIAVPWVGVVMLPASLVGTFGAALSGVPGSGLVVDGVVILGEVTLAATGWLAAALPDIVGRGAIPSIWSVALAGAIAIVALRVRSTSSRLAFALLQSVVLVVAPPGRIFPEPPRVVVFDVGQGDAILVQGRDASILVDAGRAIEGSFDMGERVVVPALAALGVNSLDLVIVSHADLDHRGGVVAVLESVEVREMWLPYGGRASPEFAGLLKVAARRGVRVREQGSGGSSRAFGDLIVDPLWPPHGTATRTRNDGSIVVRVEIAAPGEAPVSILLTGDIGSRTEAQLLERGLPLESTLLKAAHHGSRGSSSAAFIAAVDPEVVLVSAPCHGQTGLPSRAALERLAVGQADVWWTGENGAVIVGITTPDRHQTIVGWHTNVQCWSH